MRHSALEARKRILCTDIPNGTYGGFWSGYNVTFFTECGGDEYRLKMGKAYRGTVPCLIHAMDEGIKVEIVPRRRVV